MRVVRCACAHTDPRILFPPRRELARGGGGGDSSSRGEPSFTGEYREITAGIPGRRAEKSKFD